MRDRLIEMIGESLEKRTGMTGMIRELLAENIADDILAGGVIVPPCKVGDKVYLVGAITRQIILATVVTISLSKNEFYLHLENGTCVSCNQHIGKTVFLTREEAERALKGGVQE